MQQLFIWLVGMEILKLPKYSYPMEMLTSMQLLGYCILFFSPLFPLSIYFNIDFFFFFFSKNYTALQEAAIKGDINIVAFLLSNDAIDVNLSVKVWFPLISEISKL